MRPNTALILAVCGSIAATAPVSAQVPGGGGMPSAQQAAGGAIGRLTPDQQISRFENEEQRRRLSLTPEEAEAEYGQERMDFARRVAALVEEGKCAEARAMANEAGERQMALRIRRTCREGSANGGASPAPAGD